MNIIDELTRRIESHRQDNKNPCKSYATKERAEIATHKVAELVGEDMRLPENKVKYVVFYIEAWGRWVGAIDVKRAANHPRSNWCDLRISSDNGFYSY